MVYCTFNLLNSGTYMPIVRSSRLYLCYYRIWCVMPWLLVVGGQVQGSRLCVRDGGCCSSRTPSLILLPCTCRLCVWDEGCCSSRTTSLILLPCTCRLCVEQHPSSCCPAPAGCESNNIPHPAALHLQAMSRTTSLILLPCTCTLSRTTSLILLPCTCRL